MDLYEGRTGGDLFFRTGLHDASQLRSETQKSFKSKFGFEYKN